MEGRNGGWTVKGTKKIFSNKFFRVFEDDVLQPDGKPSKYATISCIPGVGVLPIDDDGNVYMTLQFRYALHRDSIEVVSGGYTPDEDTLEAAKRELLEELGIEATEWSSLGRIEAITSITDSRTDLFLARGLTFGEPRREATESMSPVKMPLREALEKVLSGDITHGETCALVMKAWFEEQKKTAAGT
jgi:ADP-ribose pyrophosphatase